jgi:DNA polymerase-3 subunit delta'
VAAGRVAHAYLLTGPAHVGKRTLARWLAAALVCEAEESASAPCEHCGACRLTAKHTHPDVQEVLAEAGRRAVTIEQVRQLEHAAGLRPYQAQRKVFVVAGVDAMQDAAANALLKTLEEPPDDTVLILTAADVSQVLPTVASRCRQVPLRPVPPAVIEQALAKRGVAPGEAATLARLAAGRPGWAIAAAGDPSRLEAHAAHLAALEQALGQSPAGRLHAAAAFGEPATAQQALEAWLTWWRDALLVQQRAGELVVHVNRVERIASMSGSLTPEAIRGALVRTQEARQHLDANANARLVVEALLLDLPVPNGT